MEIEVQQIEDDRFEALITDTSPGRVNAIRRTLVGDVPTLAIEDVTVYDNSSALFDEVVAHRLGLVPIPTDPEAYNPRDDCVCGGEGCPNCIVIYTLSEEGPGTVTSGDMIPQDESLELPDPDIPIVTLSEGQRLMLEAVACLGDGEQHTKWSPAVAPAFGQVPVIVDAESGDEIEVDRLCGEHIALRGEHRGVEEVDEDDCDLCDADVDDDQLRVEGRDDAYYFHFETDGSLTARDAAQQAIAEVRSRLADFEDHLDEL